jgi:hypothetical protein
MKKPVRCVENGLEFGSLREAGTWIGQDYQRKGNEGGSFAGSNISHVVNLAGRTAGGYHWELLGSPITSTTPSLKRTEDKLPKIYKHIKRKPPKQPKIDYPPEGYVYIFRNRWHPENVYKIGSTDNLEGRRSAARTWGPYECVDYLPFSNCKVAESELHEVLAEYRIVEDGLGSEHFRAPEEVVLQALEGVYCDFLCREDYEKWKKGDPTGAWGKKAA